MIEQYGFKLDNFGYFMLAVITMTEGIRRFPEALLNVQLLSI